MKELLDIPIVDLPRSSNYLCRPTIERIKKCFESIEDFILESVSFNHTHSGVNVEMNFIRSDKNWVLIRYNLICENIKFCSLEHEYIENLASLLSKGFTVKSCLAQMKNYFISDIELAYQFKYNKTKYKIT